MDSGVVSAIGSLMCSMRPIPHRRLCPHQAWMPAPEYFRHAKCATVVYTAAIPRNKVVTAMLPAEVSGAWGALGVKQKLRDVGREGLRRGSSYRPSEWSITPW